MYRCLKTPISLTAILFILGFAARIAGAEEKEHKTTTPIKHVVVIFQENVSFDHYFATYPNAANPKGEPRFVAREGTPTVNGLSGSLLSHNPNVVSPGFEPCPPYTTQ